MPAYFAVRSICRKTRRCLYYGDTPFCRLRSFSVYAVDDTLFDARALYVVMFVMPAAQRYYVA